MPHKTSDRITDKTDDDLPHQRDNSSLTSRRLAAFAVKEVMENHQPLEQVLAGQPSYRTLESRDRAFVRLIAATTFRRLGQIDAALKPFVRERPTKFVYAALQTASAQILYLGTPAHAAVGETVAMLKSRGSSKGFANMANAVLRKIVDQGPRLAGSQPPKVNLPGWMRGEWERAYGRQAGRKFSAQLLKDPVLDLSVKSDAAGWAEKLGGEAIGASSVRMNKIGDVPALDGFSDGEWWAQDVAATLPVQLLGDVKGLRVLDMCAAPGGKTMQLAARGAIVTALDKSETRLERVKQNLDRTKLTADIICADALEWEPETTDFDIVLLDAPCSATGTFRRHPDVLYNRSPKDVANLVRLQDKLLAKAAAFVRPGGTLIYCTCSLMPKEGRPRIDTFLQNVPDFRLIPILKAEGLDLPEEAFSGGSLRSLPYYLEDKGGMDGFFIARLEREK
ncbi:MAG: RsmB/NOP family class I SAM-dependent RNA methyltransferase [Hellea sp.]